MAEAAIVRMGRLVLHRKPGDEPWPPWHNKTWKLSEGAIATMWGCTPAAVVAACTAAMVVRLATRAACRAAPKMALTSRRSSHERPHTFR